MENKIKSHYFLCTLNRINFRNVLILIIFFSFFCVVESSQAADIYVDQTLSSNCASGNYSTTNRTCTGSDGDAYTTVQAAINAMNGGDDIFLRGGNYGPTQLTGSTASGMGHVRIPTTKSGSSDNWSSIQSYTGEWAVLDGENNCDYSLPHPMGSVLGMPYAGNDGAYDVSYWKIERLEIKNGASPDGTYASGIWLNGGPFIIRHCYIHDNIANTGGNNPGGVTGYQWHDSTIEYCYFSDNGTDVSAYEQHAAGGWQVFSDYNYQSEYWEDSPQDINLALRKNTFRYNLLDNDEHYAYVGYHNKGRQFLANKTNVTWTYEEYGDKVHHNIFLGFLTAAACQQDFQQIYSNIIVNPAVAGNRIGITITDTDMSGGNMAVAVYNNTMIGGRINNNFGKYDYVVNPYIYIYNNLMDQAPANYDSSGVINMGDPYMDASWVYDDTRTDITNNYFYRPLGTTIKATINTGACYGYLTRSEYDACYGETNYEKASSEGSDNIYAGTTGGDQYIARGSHIVSGATTIANGGTGASHPYLDGVTIPSYIGATNPNDNDWVDGVLSLDTAYMTSVTTGSDPDWIEGSGAEPDTTPPSHPTELSVE